MRTASLFVALCILTGSAFSQKIIPSRININAASKEQLASLEGIDFEIADKIIAGRPYTADELVERKILTKPAYDKIKSKVAIVPSKEIQIISSSKARKIAE